MEVPVLSITRENLNNDKPARRSSFITKNDLSEIQVDIGRIIVPSWITKLSRGFGEKSNGKVKAAEWRSLFSIYLPMTLSRLWINSTSHTLHLKALLSLSIIVNIVVSRRISRATVELYNQAIRFYLLLISTLENNNLVVSHHLALHLSTYMQLHGPCRSHWAFPFERMIGKLQRTTRNSKIGESSESQPPKSQLTANSGHAAHADEKFCFEGGAESTEKPWSGNCRPPSMESS
jgi:hypothetical protein